VFLEGLFVKIERELLMDTWKVEMVLEFLAFDRCESLNFFI
jgi:hypothetical protein